MLVALALAAVLGGARESAAQLFGSRSLGGSLARRTRTTAGRPATASNVGGEVRGNERFVRGNRQSTNFVGTDSRELRSFVGAQQGTVSGTAQSATSGLRIESAPDANQGRVLSGPPRTGMYRPRLRVEFRFTPQSPQALSTALTRQLRACPGIHQTRPIEVWVEGETATLRGEVASERDRALARLMVLFEPGISQVQSELTLTGLPRTAAGNPQIGRVRWSGPREF